MSDIEFDRKVAKNIKEYIADMRKIKDMIIWVWQEFINDEGKRLAKKMFWLTLATYILYVIKPWSLSLVFNGLAIKDSQGSMIIAGLALCGLVTIISQILNHKGMCYRELVLGETQRQLDKRTTELFFEKSLGTHIDEGNLLNEANIRKGYERVFQVKEIILFSAIENTLGLALPFLALWILNWQIALATTVMIVIHIIWSLFLSQKMMEVCLPIDKKWRAMNRFRVERLDQVERVKVNFKEKDELIELGNQFSEVIRLDRNFWLWFIAEITKRGFITYLILLIVMAYGAYQVWQNQIAIGLLYPLYIWATQLTDNLWRLGNFEHQLNSATPSILAMKQALTMPAGIDVSSDPVSLSQNASCKIEFNNIGYVYPKQRNNVNNIGDEDDDDDDDDKNKYGDINEEKENIGVLPVLNDISFVIEPGEKVALIGSSGAGKTTVMRLLLRYMDPTSGSITIDGINLRDLDIGSWLDLVGYVPQQAQILSGTIRYNLLYGLPDETKNEISDEKIWEIMRLLQIDFGERLTHGLDTLVGRNGIKLSGGQAQRLMIGAAVMKNPRFMIIDEATSSLDSTTEKLVQDGLEKVLTKERGALIITHRLNTVRRICDKFIMVSQNGHGSKVSAVANSFEKLAETCPEFKALALDQGIIL